MKKIKGIWIPEFIQRDGIRKNRLSGVQTKTVYNFLIYLHGEICSKCSRSADEIPLQIDHADGNPLRHYWKNLQLLCYKCNITKRDLSKTKSIKKSVRIGISGLSIPGNISGGNAETYLKSNYLPSFLDYIISEIENIQKNCNLKEFITDASVYCGMASETTIQRYVKQFCSLKFGMLETYKDERSGIEYLRIKESLKNLAKDDLINEIQRQFSW